MPSLVARAVLIARQIATTRRPAQPLVPDIFAGCINPSIGAVVNFYGIHPNVKPDYSKLSGPVLGLFGEKDAFVNPSAARAVDVAIKTVTGHGAGFHMPEYDKVGPGRSQLASDAKNALLDAPKSLMNTVAGVAGGLGFDAPNDAINALTGQDKTSSERGDEALAQQLDRAGVALVGEHQVGLGGVDVGLDGAAGGNDRTPDSVRAARRCGPPRGGAGRVAGAVLPQRDRPAARRRLVRDPPRRVAGQGARGAAAGALTPGERGARLSAGATACGRWPPAWLR